MEIRKPHIKSIPYEEFKDNDTLENIAAELNDGGVNVVLGSLDQMINWGRSNSLWSLTFGTSCCGIEFMAVGCARYDFSRFGFEVTRNSARQADLIMCAGTITNKMAPVFKRLYDEMAEPKYVVAVGGCTISGGPFKKSYSVVRGIDQIVPVDVYIPGCPPRPEAILYGMMQLQRKVKVEKFFGGANHKMTREEKAESMGLGGLHGISNENLSAAKIGGKTPIMVTASPNKEDLEALGRELDALEEEGKEFEVHKQPATDTEKAAASDNNQQ
uniref:NADH-quinone oxidoreductase subunit B n=1 Tax=Prevotella sp. TaxID=59823 RepID=UPI004024AF0E